jgi:hypothetical protein
MTAEDADGDVEGVPETGLTSPPDPAPRETTINKLLKGKEKARKGPLGLLDLPVDILKEIIHQVRQSDHAQVVQCAQAE